MVWGCEDSNYFSLLVTVNYIDGHCYCDSRETVKPLWADNLLWDIIGMPDNKKEPLSLRCIGAFTIHGATIYEERKELIDWDYCELQKYIADYVKHFHNSVQLVTITDYYNLIDKPVYHSDLRELLLLIYNEKYKEALDFVEKMESDSFVNNGVGLREAARKYIVDKK